MAKFLNSEGVKTLLEKLSDLFVKKDGNKVLSDVNFSTTDKTKLDNANTTTITVGEETIGGNGEDVDVTITGGNGITVTADEDTITISANVVEQTAYYLKKESQATEGAFASYKLYSKTGQGAETAVTDSAVIDIPKDYLVKSAKLETYTDTDGSSIPEGAGSAGTYIVLVMNTKDAEDAGEDGEKLYINVTSLIDVYTAGNGIDITSNKVSVKLDTTKQNGLTVGENGLGIELASSSQNGAMSKEDKQNIKTLMDALNGDLLEALKDLDTDKIKMLSELEVDDLGAKLTVSSDNDITINLQNMSNETLETGVTFSSANKALDFTASSNTITATVNVDTTGGLKVDASKGITTNLGNGLQTTNNAIAIKTKANNGLTVDTDGIYVALKTNGGLSVDTTGIAVDAMSTEDIETIFTELNKG